MLNSFYPFMKYFPDLFKKKFFPTQFNKLLPAMFGASLCVQVMALSVAEEYQIKTTFLYNFVNFITWPNSAFTSNNDPFRICLFGKDPFGQLLDLKVKNKMTHNRSLTVERINHLSHLSRCHILYLNVSQQSQLTEIFEVAKNYPILTVSDMKNFIIAGGMIKFFNENNKVRLAINPKALNKVQLKPAADLLRLSVLVEIP